MKKFAMKGLGLLALSAAVGMGQAYAHTGVRDQASENANSFNGFTIGHGCASASGEQEYPVLGQTALFPDGATAVWRDAAGAVIQTGGNGNGTIGTATLSLGVTGYAGMLSPFATAQEIVDGNGVVRGLHWRDGAMEPKLGAITPFKVKTPVIENNCVKSLKIRIAVINWCDIAKNQQNDIKGPYKAPKDAFKRKIPMTVIPPAKQTNVAVSPFFTSMSKGNGDNNRADWWFQNLNTASALYNDPDLQSSWATLTVNNSAEDLENCNGTLIDSVSVEPDGPDFDAYLTEQNTQPFTKGPGPF
jgi:hypothetical protein